MKACFYCGEESAQLGTCPRCRDYMARGILLIQVADGETSQIPRRLGGLALVPDAILRPALGPEVFEAARRRRAAFIPDAAWRALGLYHHLPSGCKDTDRQVVIGPDAVINVKKLPKGGY